jgi:hypothetical protein
MAMHQKLAKREAMSDVENQPPFTCTQGKKKDARVSASAFQFFDLPVNTEVQVICVSASICPCELAIEILDLLRDLVFDFPIVISEYCLTN